MSVKRKRIKVRHPDNDGLSVELGMLEVDLTTPKPAEDVDAIREMLEAASDPGRTDFITKQVHVATAVLAERAVKLHENQKKPRGSRRPNLDCWLDEKIAADPQATTKALRRLAESNPLVSGDVEELRGGFDTRVSAARNRLKKAAASPRKR